MILWSFCRNMGFFKQIKNWLRYYEKSKKKFRETLGTPPPSRKTQLSRSHPGDTKNAIMNFSNEIFFFFFLLNFEKVFGNGEAQFSPAQLG